MRRHLMATLLASAVLAAAPALADRGHRDGHGHRHGHHHRDVVRVVRYEPYARVQPVYVREWREPVRYYYDEPRYRGHHEHDDAYKWVAGAIVLGEIIHHTQGGHR